VHELAHVNGAPGGMVSKAAEATLPPCGFDDLFNPALVGMKSWRPLESRWVETSVFSEARGQ